MVPHAARVVLFTPLVLARPLPRIDEEDYLRPIDVVQRFLGRKSAGSFCELPKVDASKLSAEDFEDLAQQHPGGLVLQQAGSERLKESLSEGNARKETQAINKSLFTLGQVISQLSQGRPERHVPYRNSKLTQLLQDSFGGSALCLMVTCISPPSAFAEETVNSLNYAQKAMNIQNTPILQLDEEQRVLFDLRSENAQLRRELQGYKHRFGALEGGYAEAEDAGAARARAALTPRASVDVGADQVAKASPRTHSLPPDFSPQAPMCRPPLPSAVASPNSARSGSREGSGSGGSYALAAVKRQQLKAPHGGTRSAKIQGKQLPPLPQRGSTSGSAPSGVRAEAPTGATPISWRRRYRQTGPVLAYSSQLLSSAKQQGNFFAMTFFSQMFSGFASLKKRPESSCHLDHHGTDVAKGYVASLSQRERNRAQCHKELEVFLKTYGLKDVHSPRKASQSLPEADGLYPIHLAAIEGKYQIVRALLASNVDSESRSPEGRTALDYAENLNRNGSHEDVLFLLRGKVKVLCLQAAVKHMQQDSEFDAMGHTLFFPETERLPEMIRPSRIRKVAL